MKLEYLLSSTQLIRFISLEIKYLEQIDCNLKFLFFLKCTKKSFNKNNNTYYIKIWSINNNISEFCKAARKLSISFKHLKLNTDISLIINNKIRPNKDNYRNITIH